MISWFFFSLLALATAYSDPGSCSGSCWAHDPAVIQRVSDGKYFRFNTGSGIVISSADDISGSWTDLGYVLPDGSSIDLDGNTDLWAPDVHYLDGTYYLYYAVSTFGSQDSSIGVASSTTMEADSWTDHGAIGVASSSSKSYNAIDPNWIVVGSTYYLNFGSFWDDIYQVEMSSSTSKRSTASSYNIEYNSTGSHASEGSFMFYYDGYYKPAQGEEYHISMCRSTTGTGSFVDKNGVACTSSGGSILLASHGTTYGPGGQGVYTDTSRGLVLYYHYADTSSSGGIGDGNYFFGWNTLSWSDGWPVV